MSRSITDSDISIIATILNDSRPCIHKIMEIANTLKIPEAIRHFAMCSNASYYEKFVKILAHWRMKNTIGDATVAKVVAALRMLSLTEAAGLCSLHEICIFKKSIFTSNSDLF